MSKITKSIGGVMSLMVVASLCAPSSTTGQQSGAWDPENPPGWTLLKLGEKKNSFSFAKNGAIEYRGKLLVKCNYNPKDSRGWEAAISSVSPKKSFRLLICWENGQGGVDARVVNTKTAEIIARSIVPSGWGIAKWVSWAPDEQYALVFAVGEVTMGDTEVIDLRSGNSREIHFKKLIANDKELQDFDPATIQWLSPIAFRLRLDVHCNPYELGDEKCKYGEVLMSSNARVTLNPLNIEY
jgi:hypothetical protein